MSARSSREVLSRGLREFLRADMVSLLHCKLLTGPRILCGPSGREDPNGFSGERLAAVGILLGS